MFFRRLLLAVLLTFIAVSAYALPEIVDVVRQTKDGVVHVEVEGTKTIPNHPLGNDEFFRRFFGDNGGSGGQNRDYKFGGLGSGFIIDASGLVITNNHVIEGADKINIKTADKKEFAATLVGRDALTDLALLKIDPKGAKLKVLPIGDSDKIEVGEWVVAIGSPQGLEWTVTQGIISAKGRNLGAGPYDSFIQTDASINQGNSGGPLLNMHGEVVGVNTMILSNGQGLSFSVPSNMLRELLPQLKGGKVQRGWLGITMQSIDDNLAKSFSLPDTEGALVADVIKSDPADKAGVKSGDVIRLIDGQKVTDSRELTRMVGGHKPGDTIKLGIVRDGKNLTLSVKLGERKTTEDEAVIRGGGTEESPIRARDLNDSEKSKYDISGGAVIMQVQQGSNAYKSGLAAGDVVVWMNRQDVKSARQLTDGYNAMKSGSIVSMKILAQGGTRFIAFSKE